MRAAVLRAFDVPLQMEDLELLDLPADRVLVETKAAPFCSTDVTSFHGLLGKKPPTILGHAAVGTVLEVGADVHGITPGQRVVVPGTPECGTCFYCALGRPDQCSDLFDIGGVYPDVARDAGGALVSAAGCVGAYAEVMSVSGHQVFPLDTDLDWTTMSLLGCGVTTGVGAVLNVAKVQPGQSVAVVGLGHLGQWMVQTAALVGASPIVAVDPLPGRRSTAEQLGATHTADPEAAASTVADLTDGRGADVVLEAGGTAEGQRLALALSRRAGTVVLSSLGPAGTEVTLPQAPLAVHGRAILSTQNGNVRMRRDLPRYVELLERGALDAGPIITRTYPLDDINSALARSETREDLSGVVVF